MADQAIEVHLDAPELGPERRVGTAYRRFGAARPVTSLSLDPEWLRDRASFSLGPDIGTWEGEQYFDAVPGILSDAAPDRWGRTLMDRREALMARAEGRRRRQLDDWAYLLGVSDPVRMGALRLLDRAGGYIDSTPLSVPPIAQLRQLEEYARQAERGLPQSRTDAEKWIRMLIAPGSSLGGVRPKANFQDERGALWIAKFPSRHDRRDVAAWEYVIAVLARKAGIDTPEAKLLKLGSEYGTFAVRRFDRTDGGHRRLYASAMTLTGLAEGTEASYLDIAVAIRDHGDPNRLLDDQHQLFRRLTFNVLVGNRDDHLRNHGFLREPGGWRLAPAFDVNPNPEKAEHVLAIDEGIHQADLELVRKTAKLYDVQAPDAVIDEVRGALVGWRKEARAAGISREEIEEIGDQLALTAKL